MTRRQAFKALLGLTALAVVAPKTLFADTVPIPEPVIMPVGMQPTSTWTFHNAAIVNDVYVPAGTEYAWEEVDGGAYYHTDSIDTEDMPLAYDLRDKIRQAEKNLIAMMNRSLYA